jgi:uncharacterized DUF497 family protein
MLFEWDPTKARTNLKKHGVAFELATTIFSDPLHLSVLERKTSSDERWVSVGLSADLSTIVVVHTYVERKAELEIIRIISARKATRKERAQYEEGI